MFNLTASLSLSIISFLASAFVILRILFSLLPIAFKNGQLTRTSERINLRPIPATFQAYLWLTLVDLLSSAAFIWEVFEQHFGGASGTNISTSAGSAARLWLATNIRPICLVCILFASFFSARRNASTNFGRLGWRIWVPSVLLGTLSTALAGVFALKKIRSFYPSSTTFLCAMTTLNVVVLLYQTNLPKWDETESESSAAKVLNSDSSPTRFSPEDVEAIKNRDSWVTSIRNSTRTSYSSFSFDSSIAIPHEGGDEIAEIPAAHHNPSRSGFLTAQSVSTRGPMLKSAWSLSTTILANTTRTGETQPRGTLSAIPAHMRSEMMVNNCCAPPAVDINVLEKGQCYQWTVDLTTLRKYSTIWAFSVLFTLALSLPYLVTSGSQSTEVLLMLSVTLQAPFLMLSMLFVPLPLFEFSTIEQHTSTERLKPKESLTEPRRSSSSITIVADRRSGDVWLEKGEAVDGRGKLGRATSLLARHPKLVVLHPEDVIDEKVEKEFGGRGEKARGDIPAGTGMSSYVAVKSERTFGDEHGEGSDAEVDADVVAGAEADISQPSVETSPDTIENVAAAHASILSLPASMPNSGLEPALPSAATSLRRSSGSTRGSKASRLLRAYLKPELEPIPDASFTLKHHSRSESSLLRILKKAKQPNEDGGSTLIGSVAASSSKTRAPLRSVSNGSQASLKSSMAIDSLSAKVLPILVPRITIGPDTMIEQTLERKPGSRLHRSISSPILTSALPPHREGNTVRLVGKGRPSSRTSSQSHDRAASQPESVDSTHRSGSGVDQQRNRIPDSSRSASSSSRRSNKHGTPPSSFRMLPLPNPPEQAYVSQDMPVEPMKPVTRGRSQRYLGIPSRFLSPPPVRPKNPKRLSSSSSHSSLVQMGLAITSDEPDPFRRTSVSSSGPGSVTGRTRTNFFLTQGRSAPRPSDTGLSVQEATDLLSDTVKSRGTSSSGTSGTTTSSGFLKFKNKRSRLLGRRDS